MRVLIVEDNAITVDALTVLLRRAGHQVRFEGDGLAALTYLAASSTPLPEVLVLDLRLPGMDGEELLARLEEHEKWRAIPVILITAVSLDEIAPLQQRWPRLQVLAKPFPLPVLLQMLEELASGVKSDS